jgi:hypothetical protein
MMMLNEQIRPDHEVVDTELEGQETVLLHLQNKVYFSLNATGTRIWRGMKENLTLSQISQRLQEEFEIEAEVAQRSVLALAHELCEQKLARRAQD